MPNWTGYFRKRLILQVVILLWVAIACSTFLYEDSAAPANEEPVDVYEPAPTETLTAPPEQTDVPPLGIFPGNETKEPPSQTVSLDLNTIYAEVVESLPLGSALFDPESEMRQGEVYTVEVRVSPVSGDDIESDEELKATLTADLETGDAVIIVPVRVSTVMRAELTGADFSITPLTEEEQIRDTSRPYLQWQWEVRPEKKGLQRLTLHLSVVVNAEGLGDKTHSISEVREVSVTGNPMYSVRTILATNWEWVASGLVLPLVGWIWRRIRSRRSSVARG